jgi:hypothetical protein
VIELRTFPGCCVGERVYRRDRACLGPTLAVLIDCVGKSLEIFPPHGEQALDAHGGKLRAL